MKYELKDMGTGEKIEIDAENVNINENGTSAVGKGETILEEAARLTSEDRQQVYGHPADDYARTAALWSAYLGTPVTALQAQMCMVLVKVSRLANTPGHRDSIVDIAGYARTYEMTMERDGVLPAEEHPDDVERALEFDAKTRRAAEEHTRDIERAVEIENKAAEERTHFSGFSDVVLSKATDDLRDVRLGFERGWADGEGMSKLSTLQIALREVDRTAKFIMSALKKPCVWETVGRRDENGDVECTTAVSPVRKGEQS